MNERYPLGTVGLLLAAALMLGGCVSNPAREPGDPFEGFNRSFYDFNDAVDRQVFQPIARGYVKVTPKPVRRGITNFFDNVGYLNTVFNDLLQAKLAQAAGDLARFVVNSSVGLGGLFDPATRMGLVEHDEDLGQTFGVWGAGEGAYLVLPLFGPDSLRDVGDRVTSALLNPLFYLSVSVTAPLTVVDAVNQRANLLDETRVRDQAALDPYVFTREAWRQRRLYLIYDGNPPTESIEDILLEEEEGTPAEEPGVLKVF